MRFRVPRPYSEEVSKKRGHYKTIRLLCRERGDNEGERPRSGIVGSVEPSFNFHAYKIRSLIKRRKKKLHSIGRKVANSLELPPVECEKHLLNLPQQCDIH